MRVLWFTGVSPNKINQYLNFPSLIGPASWVQALSASFVNNENIKLAIASSSPVDYVKIELENIVYYSIQGEKKTNSYWQYVANWLHVFFPPNDNLSQCLEIIAEFQPDVIQVHGTENPFGLISKSVNVPVIISIQGILNEIQKKYLAGFSPEDYLQILATKDFYRGGGVVNTYFNLKWRAKREKTITRNSKFFLGRTHWDRTWLQNENPSAHYFHLDEVLRDEFFLHRKTDFGMDKKKVVISCTIGNDVYKGGECLLKAVGLLINNSSMDVHLKIIGVSENAFIKKIYQRVAKKLKIENKVNWLGRLNSKQIAEELISSDIFVYPSHIDNSPNALCEAQLLGLSCIASNVGGISSLVIHNQTGLLFKDNDPAELAKCISRLVNDREFARLLAHNGRKAAISRHDPALIYHQLIDIYSDCIKTQAS